MAGHNRGDMAPKIKTKTGHTRLKSTRWLFAKVRARYASTNAHSRRSVSCQAHSPRDRRVQGLEDRSSTGDPSARLTNVPNLLLLPCRTAARRGLPTHSGVREFARYGSWGPKRGHRSKSTPLSTKSYKKRRDPRHRRTSAPVVSNHPLQHHSNTVLV